MAIDLQVVFKSGYICLMGHWVERVALQMSSSVPERALNQRRKRDGYPYHITIANAQQTAQAMRSARSLRIMNEIAAASSLPVNLGLGMVQNAQNESRSWYCVISWPAGQQIRRCFSLLPQDLHLTLGFDHKDIHIHKGPSTLLTHNIAAASLNREQIEGLIYAALLESYTSKDGSLKSLTLALAQAKLIQDEYLISSAENNLIRVRRGERLKEIEGPTDYQLLEDFPQRTVTSVADITVKLESLQMAQKQRPSNYLVPEISERTAMTNVIRKLETLEVDLK
jgi:DNA-binding Lrp family transcriptional regulator